MDLSCHANRLNDQYATWLMPGQEMHETPQGDVSQDRRLLTHPLRRQKALDRLPSLAP